MRRKLITTITCLCMCLNEPGKAHASPYAIVLQDPIVTADAPIVRSIKTGEKAPFDGVLLNSRAAAEAQVKLEQADERCEVRVQKEVQIASASLQYKLDVSSAKELSANEKIKLLEDISKKQRELYTEQIKSTQKLASRRDWGGLYFAGGLLGGVLIILAGAYAVKEIRESP